MVELHLYWRGNIFLFFIDWLDWRWIKVRPSSVFSWAVATALNENYLWPYHCYCHLSHTSLPLYNTNHLARYPQTGYGTTVKLPALDPLETVNWATTLMICWSVIGKFEIGCFTGTSAGFASGYVMGTRSEDRLDTDHLKTRDCVLNDCSIL